ncbi:MAG TPA: polysaccharide deacetylase [Ruminococcaceae bacterium]|nr:polysaccharide deacetylase [Oscillospiraceae bacterium]
MVIKFKKLYLLLFAIVVLTVSACVQIVRAQPTAATPAPTPLPIVMYHQVNKSANRAGTYCVTLDELESDFRYIKECGYTAITTEQLLRAVDGKAALPDKPIMITFDDGFESIFQYVQPLLKQYDLCAVVSVVGAYTDRYSELDDHSVNYAYLTWSEIEQLAQSGTVEIQNHSYDLHQINNCGHKGAKKRNGESEEEYRAFLQTDLQKMQELCEKNAKIKPIAFTYPFGCYSKESKEIIREMGFRACFVCEEKINSIDYENTDWLYHLCRFNRPHGVSTQLFFGKLFGE